MEMEKAYYAVLFKPEYLRLTAPSRSEDIEARGDDGPIDDSARGAVVVSITQGGFGQDVVDDERQVKERFLEYIFAYSGLDIPRSAESFDEYFELRPVDEMVDLDDEQ
ncbi:MAG TPA: hypothetical protein VI756_18060 [Blastocatellia bacterium]